MSKNETAAPVEVFDVDGRLMPKGTPVVVAAAPRPTLPTEIDPAFVGTLCGVEYRDGVAYTISVWTDCGMRSVYASRLAVNGTASAVVVSTRVTSRGARGQRALAEQKRLGGKRGRDGRRITDDELDEHISTVRAEHPDSSMSDELLYARWIERLSFDRSKFVAAWERAAAAAH